MEPHTSGVASDGGAATPPSVVSLVLAHDPEEDAKRVFEKGLEELEGGSLESAIDGFKRAWEQVPTNLKYLQTLAMVYHETMQYSEVLEICKTVLKADSTPDFRVISLCLMSKAYLAQHDLFNSLENLKKCVQISDAGNTVTQILGKSRIPFSMDEISHSNDIACVAVRLYREQAFRLSNALASRRDPGDMNETIHLAEQVMELFAVGDPARPKSMFNLAGLLLHRNDTMEDVDHALRLLKEIISVADATSPLRTIYVGSLGYGLVCQADRSGAIDDLNSAIAAFEDYFDSAKPEFPNYTKYLCSLSTLLVRRVERTGNRGTDIDRAISLLDNAFHTPNNQPDAYRSRGVLARALLYRFESGGDVGDINRSIEILESVLEEIADNHPDRRSYHNDLGLSYMGRFDHCGDINDIRVAIEQFNTAIKLTPDGDASLFTYNYNVGRALIAQFPHRGDTSDVEGAFTILEDVVSHTSDSDSHRAARLNMLGVALRLQFETKGDVGYLERSIQVLDDAVQLLAVQPDRRVTLAICLGTLSVSLNYLFDRMGDEHTLERAVSAAEKALSLLPADDRRRAGLLNNLAISLCRLYESKGEAAYLKRAISLLGDAIPLTLNSHADHPKILTALGNALDRQFDLDGDVTDINTAISHIDRAIELTPPHHLALPIRLDNLGNALISRYKRNGDIADITRAIDIMGDLVNSKDKHLRPAHLASLGMAYVVRFQYSDEIADIQQAMEYLEEAVGLTDNGSPDYSRRLTNYGNALLHMYERTGKSDKLESAIEKLKKAVTYVSHAHADRPMYLNNLGAALCRQFDRLHNIKDVDCATTLLADAARSATKNRVYGLMCLSSLGNALLNRFGYLGSLPDIHRAIKTLEDAEKLAVGMPHYRAQCLTSLGVALRRRFEQLGNRSDIERAISVLDEATQDTASSREYSAIRRVNLGTALLIMFSRHGGEDNINRAVSVLEKALEDTEENARSYPLRQGNLGAALSARYQDLEAKDDADFERAVKLLRSAIGSSLRNHPTISIFRYNLAVMYEAKFRRLGNNSDLKDARDLYSEVVLDRVAVPSHRFDAAVSGATLAREQNMIEEALKDYVAAIDILPSLIWRGLDPVSRLENLALNKHGFARDAAACAISSGNLEQAIELLDQGRSVFWGQASQLRMEMRELEFAHPTEAEELRRIGLYLDALPFSDGTSSSLSAGGGKVDPDVVTQNYHDTAGQWDSLVAQIRQFSDFQNFLRVTPFSELRLAAAAGPVVVINISDLRSDALIVHHSDPVTCIPLPEIDPRDIEGWAKTIVKCAQRPPEQFYEYIEPALIRILPDLWDAVGSFIADGLGSQLSSKRPRRVWWCPTGPLVFLPIHAAGPFDGRPGIADLFTSSYTPTLSTLLRARKKDVETRPFRLLAVTQPNTPGQKPLKYAQSEFDLLSKLLTPKLPNALIPANAEKGKVDFVRDQLDACSWVHFACHGEQNEKKPWDSAFILDNGPLFLHQVAKLRLPHADFAFLSVCQTSTGSVRWTEESMHLAAVLQFVGFKGVIGTMWPIRDDDGPVVAETVYGSLLGVGGSPDSTMAAHALREAVTKLRKNSVPFSRWVPFIHLGI